MAQVSCQMGLVWLGAVLVVQAKSEVYYQELSLLASVAVQNPWAPELCWVCQELVLLGEVALQSL